MRLATLAVLTCVSLHAGPAAAIQQHTFVALSGAADTGDCTRSQPCATLSYASTKTNAGGVLTILDEGDFDPATIFTEITIEGQGPGTRIWNRNATGLDWARVGGHLVLRNLSIGADFTNYGQIGVNFSGASLRMENVTISNQIGGGAIGVYIVAVGNTTVEMRNVTIDYTGNGSTGAAVLIDASTTSRVEISDCSFGYLSNGIVVKGIGSVQLSVSNTTIAHANAYGIFFNPSGGTHKFEISDSKVVNNGGAGVYLAPSGGSVSAKLARSTFDNNSIGVRADAINSSKIRVSLADVSASNNTTGIYATRNTAIDAIRTTVSNNTNAGISMTSPALTRIGSSLITGNGTGLAGPVSSYGNNQLLGNTTQGSASPVSPGSVP